MIITNKSGANVSPKAYLSRALTSANNMFSPQADTTRPSAVIPFEPSTPLPDRRRHTNTAGPQPQPGRQRRRHDYLAVTRPMHKRTACHAVPPADIGAMLAKGELMQARAGLTLWIRQHKGPGRTPTERAAIIAAANAINNAFITRTDAGACPDTALAQRKSAICLTADSLNASDAFLGVSSAEVISVKPAFLRAFRAGDVILGIAQAREKHLS